METRSQQDNRYHLLVRNIHEYVYSVTFVNGGMQSTYHSAKSVEVTGYSPGEYEANPDLWFSMIHVDDRQRVIDFLNEVKSGKKPLTIEHRIVHKDRSIRWVANTAAVEYDDQGRISSLNGYVLDVTARKNAEARQGLAIRVLEMLNRTGAEKGIITEILTMIKQYLGIEAAGIRLLRGDDFPYYAVIGFPPQFVERENSLLVAEAREGRPMLDCLCGALLSGCSSGDSSSYTTYGSFWTNGLKDFLESREFCDLSIHARGGCTYEGYESVALIPLKSNDQVIGLIQFNDRRRGVFALDTIMFLEGIGASIGISHSRKMAEEALRESNERYQSLFENSLAVMLLIDPDSGKIISANFAASVFYGYDMSVLTGMNIAQINTLDEGEVFRKMQDVKTMQQSHFYFQHRLASGAVRDVEVYTTPLQLGGKVLLHSIIHDITERRRAEIALRESGEELRRRNELFEKEMEIAQLVQKRFIPSKVDSTERIKVDFRYYPHEAIGGDYFSVVPLPRNGMGVFIGDVVGHGIAASLFLSLLKASTDRVSKHYGLNPKLYLQMLNTELIDYLDFNFITAVYGVVQFAEGSPAPVFSFSNGGHPGPVLHRRSAGSAELLHASGSILGVFPELNCSIGSVPMEPGDRIFLYTDGIPESRDKNGEIIGFDAMPELVKRASDHDLGSTLDLIINQVYDFTGGNSFDDDIVLIGMEIL